MYKFLSSCLISLLYFVAIEAKICYYIINSLSEVFMYIDTHLHMLPYMDDGASSVEVAVEMFGALKMQNVVGAVLAPHFYHNEITVDHFLAARKAALSELRLALGKKAAGFRFFLASEVHIAQGVADDPDLSKLTLRIGKNKTKLLPIELPVANFDEATYAEITKIIQKHRLNLLICNLERCTIMYSPDQLKKVLTLPRAGFYINALSFRDKNIAKMAWELHMSGKQVFICSNAHNMFKRPPDISIDAVPIADEYCRLVYKRIAEANLEFFQSYN
jgi:protein-tyrosine phosphatase